MEYKPIKPRFISTRRRWSGKLRTKTSIHFRVHRYWIIIPVPFPIPHTSKDSRKQGRFQNSLWTNARLPKMPSKSLRKVQKHIGKKKGRTPALHEKSRDAQRLRRASARSDKLSKVGKARANLNQPLRKCRLTSE